MIDKLMGYGEGFGKVPEISVGAIPLIRANREDRTTVGIHAVDGYYVIRGGDIPIRQIREYDVKTDEEAVQRAREDGLVRAIMVETYLSEPVLCSLLNREIIR